MIICQLAPSVGIATTGFCQPGGIYLHHHQSSFTSATRLHLVRAIRSAQIHRHQQATNSSLSGIRNLRYITPTRLLQSNQNHYYQRASLLRQWVNQDLRPSVKSSAGWKKNLHHGWLRYGSRRASLEASLSSAAATYLWAIHRKKKEERNVLGKHKC
jgi:hypothetical protein